MIKRDALGNIRLCKLVPEKMRITQDRFKAYCHATEKTVSRAEKTIENAVKNECKSNHNFMNLVNVTTININSTRELYRNVYEVCAIFANSYECYDKHQKLAIAVLEFNIKSIVSVLRTPYWARRCLSRAYESGLVVQV